MTATENAAWNGEERRARRTLPPHAEEICIVRDSVAPQDATCAEGVADHLMKAGFPTRMMSSRELVVDACASVLVVVTMLRLDNTTGAQLAVRLRELRPGVPVIVLAAEPALEDAVAALRAGAFDFIEVPKDEALLAATVRRAVETATLTRELEHLHQTSPAGKDGFIGSSVAMRVLRDAIARLAANDVTVQIKGETGAGKELAARAIHMSSERRLGPFVAINCAAVPASLLESELFGHVRGAYTDAKTHRDGFFVQASGGTLFLDEIGDMPLEMQPKLLRALQEHRVRPLGGSTEISFDTRVISATHHDLEQLVAMGRFRQDLYYRLNVVSLDLPPLRARGNDVIEIATAVLARAAVRDRRPPLRLSPEVAERLLAYDWPGNVRELENCMERLVALARTDVAAVADLPLRIRDHTSDTVLALQDVRDILTLEKLEDRYIHHVIKLLGGNKSAAADALGIDRRTLYRRLEKGDRNVSVHEGALHSIT